MTPPDTGKPYPQQYVTNEQLDRKLEKMDNKIDKLPTVKHVQFLVLSAVVASQIIPGLNVAKAAAPAFHGTLRAVGLLP